MNLLAGVIAVRFDYPSLFSVDPTFVEYALPLPFTWALSHLLSTLLSISLLMCIRVWQEKQLKIFRIACLVIFVLLFLEIDAKSPFSQFGKIDSLCAFLFSLVLAPPTRETNPLLVNFLMASAGVILLSIASVLFSRWQHRVPTLVSTS